MIKPTIKDVAALAGVSTTTVSHVINNTRFVSEEVRSRVTSAMNQMGYLPNSIARSLRKGVTNTIGMILPDSSNPFFAELGHAIEDLAFSQGYSVILCNTEGDPVKELFYINLLHQKQVDGMIFVATGDNPTTVNFFINNPINVVLIDRQLKVVDDLKIPTVMVDNETGAFIATSHLIHLGHRRIACISGSSKLTPSYQREIGYKKALEKEGIIIDESLVTQGNFDPQSGYQSFYKLIKQHDLPSAVFVCNDLMALGVMRAAFESGIRIPEDLSVIGFDNIHLSSYTTPALTTMAQPLQSIAAEAINYLAKMIKKEPISDPITCLPVSLIERDSCSQYKG